jgi:predicted nucleotidyltransferase
MIKVIADYFRTQPVLKAWLFGSYARGEQSPQSDVDILFVPDKSQHFSLFTLGGMYEDLKDLLSAYCHDGRIRADWITRDSVRVSDYRSERLLYAHLGFSSRFSKELFCSFRNGLLYALSYKNHLFHEGIPFDKAQRSALSASFPYDQFPELKGRGSISIYIRDIQVDENGRLADCRLSIGGTALKGLGNEESLAEQIVNWARKKMLSTDWQVYECDGINTLGYWSQIDLRFGWKRPTP